MFSDSDPQRTRCGHHHNLLSELNKQPENARLATNVRAILSRMVGLVDAMAGEGIVLQGHDDPADMMVELVDLLGCGEAEDPSACAVEMIRG